MSDRAILVVEDEEAIRQMLKFGLCRAGFEFHEAIDATTAFSRINVALPDLVLIDWMLPGISGIDFTRMLRSRPHTRHLPIIMLSARARDVDTAAGLDSGADDYVTKPFSIRELLARIEAVLRRVVLRPGEGIVDLHGLKLDSMGRSISSRVGPLEVSPILYRLLEFLMTHPEKVLTRDKILNHVWGSGVYVTQRTVDVHILRLRQTLERHRCEHLIQTVRGVGYRFSGHCG